MTIKMATYLDLFGGQLVRIVAHDVGQVPLAQLEFLVLLLEELDVLLIVLQVLLHRLADLFDLLFGLEVRRLIADLHDSLGYQTSGESVGARRGSTVREVPDRQTSGNPEASRHRETLLRF